MTRLRNKTTLLLLFILLLALGLRLIALNSRTLWYDETFAVLFSEKGMAAMVEGTLTPVNGAAADVHPLLYYTTLGGWMAVFGESPVAVRMYSVLVGVATVGMLYVVAQELFGETTSLVAALIAAVAPFAVQYSQEVRMYALLGLLLLVATWCFLRGWHSGKLIYWAAFGVCAGLSMYVQQLAGFYLVAISLVPFLTRREQVIKQLPKVVFGAGIALIIYLPWLVNLPAQFGKVGEYWIKKPTLIDPLVTLWSFTFLGELSITDRLTLLISLTAVTLLLIILIYRVARVLSHPTARYKNDVQPLAFTLWLIFAPMTLMWLVSQWRSVYLTRALLPSGLMFYIVLAWLFTRARLPRPILMLIAIICAVSVGVGLYTHYTWHTFPRPQFDAADQYLAAQWQPGDRVVHANKLTMLPMVYYDRLRSTTANAPSLAQTYIQDVPGSPQDTLARPTQNVLNLLAEMCMANACHVGDQSSQRVWYVIFKEEIAQAGGTLTDQAWLDKYYHRVSSQSFDDLVIYLYDQPTDAARLATCWGGS